MKICSHCGGHVEKDDAKFCNLCGGKFEEIFKNDSQGNSIVLLKDKSNSIRLVMSILGIIMSVIGIFLFGLFNEAGSRENVGAAWRQEVSIDQPYLFNSEDFSVDNLFALDQLYNKCNSIAVTACIVVAIGIIFSVMGVRGYRKAKIFGIIGLALGGLAFFLCFAMITSLAEFARENQNYLMALWI